MIKYTYMLCAPKHNMTHLIAFTQFYTIGICLYVYLHLHTTLMHAMVININRSKCNVAYDMSHLLDLNHSSNLT
jgi:hypothetical protein